MNNMETLGPLIRTTRERKGIRAADLAYQIGKDPSYLSKLERDLLKEIPPPDVIAALEREMGIPQVAMLRALGYAIPAGPAPAYPSDEVRVLAERWHQMNADERRMITWVLNTHLQLHGDEGVDNLVQSVDEPSLAFRRSVAG